MTAVEYPQAEPTGPLIYNVDRSCAELGGISKATIYRLVAAGQLRKIKIGRRSYFAADELRRYVDALAR